MHLWPWTKRVVDRGSENWHKTHYGYTLPNSDFSRDWVLYEITNHWTGSVTLKKEYLN